MPAGISKKERKAKEDKLKAKRGQKAPASIRNKATRALLHDPPLSKEQTRERAKLEREALATAEASMSAMMDDASSDDEVEQAKSPKIAKGGKDDTIAKGGKGGTGGKGGKGVKGVKGVKATGAEITTTKKTLKNKNKRKRTAAESNKDDAALEVHDDVASRGVIYVGNVPHGFYETEMRSYFEQYGEVTRIRLSRNKKTGHFKHYAFVEFRFLEVAAVAAKSNDNYMLYNHILRCALIPRDKIHPLLFKGANKTYHVRNALKQHRKAYNMPRTADAQEALLKKRLATERKNLKKLAALGINYSYAPLKELVEQRRREQQGDSDGEEEELELEEQVVTPAKKRSKSSKLQSKSVPALNAAIAKTPVKANTPRKANTPSLAKLASSEVKTPGKAKKVQRNATPSVSRVKSTSTTPSSASKANKQQRRPDTPMPPRSGSVKGAATAKRPSSERRPKRTRA